MLNDLIASAAGGETATGWLFDNTITMAYDDGDNPLTAGDHIGIHIDRDDADALIPEEVTQEIFKNVVEESAVMQVARKLPNMSRRQLVFIYQVLKVVNNIIWYKASFINTPPFNTFGDFRMFLSLMRKSSLPRRFMEPTVGLVY